MECTVEYIDLFIGYLSEVSVQGSCIKESEWGVSNIFCGHKGYIYIFLLSLYNFTVCIDIQVHVGLFNYFIALFPKLIPPWKLKGGQKKRSFRLFFFF